MLHVSFYYNSWMELILRTNEEYKFILLQEIIRTQFAFKLYFKHRYAYLMLIYLN